MGATAPQPLTPIARIESAPRGIRRFLVRFSVSAALLLAAYYFPYDSRGFIAACLHGYLVAYAHLAGGAISLFDSAVRVDGTRILGRMSLEFALSCDAMDVLLLFAAATYAFPASWRARALGFGAACASLVAINVIRIVALYFIGIYAPSRFELFHLQLFPLVIVALAAVGFVVWTRMAGAPAAGGHAPLRA
jgi:exosortase/archaeosortase family protein